MDSRRVLYCGLGICGWVACGDAEADRSVASDTAAPDASVANDAPDTDIAAPDVAKPDVPLALIEVLEPSALGIHAFSANARIQPHGFPTEYYFEYGPDDAYGFRSPRKALAPRLAAHYTASWDDGLEGWRGGVGLEIAHQAEGGASGGFLRYREPNGTDYNHTDGIGLLHLVQYFYPGRFTLDYPSANLGGADPDFRDARVEVSLRGTDWNERGFTSDPSAGRPFFRGDELTFWAQADASADDSFSFMSNWAHTGTWLTEALYDGSWVDVEYRLETDTNAWTYAGQDRTQGRDLYVYAPIDDILGHLDVDFFHVLLYVDPYMAMFGTIDIDELDITFRNHSLLYAGNGATLRSAPTDARDDPDRLTDGWRSGEGHTWRTPPPIEGPVRVEYAFAHPVTIDKFFIGNDAGAPSSTFAAFVSLDGEAWTPLASGAIPSGSPHGAAFDHALVSHLDAPASFLRVEVTGPNGAAQWGVGEIEAFGAGAVMATDDDWYHVSQDLDGVEPGTNVHFRVVAENELGIVYGPDQVYAVPTGDTPEVVTGEATIIDAGHVRIQGRINTFGAEAWWRFELGREAGAYDIRTALVRTGQEITPRTFANTLELAHADLAAWKRGDTIHYRFVACSGCSDADASDDVVTAGAEATFVVP